MSLPNLTFVEIQHELEHRDENIQSTIIVVTAVLLALCYLSVTLRVLARYMQNIRLAWNDYTIIAALICVTSMCGVTFYAVDLGLGKHVIFVGLFRGRQLGKMLYVLEVLLNPTNFFVKLSILLLYHSIFGDSKEHRWFNITLRGLIYLWVVETILCSLLFIFQCNPIYYAWSTDHQTGCFNLKALIIGLTSCSVVINFAMFILPMPLIWKLKLSRKKRISIGLLFGFGAIGFLTCCVRAAASGTFDPTNPDVSYNHASQAILVIAEMTIDIICACLPTLRPIYNLMFKRANADGTYSEDRPSRARIIHNPDKSLFTTTTYPTTGIDTTVSSSQMTYTR